jgi:hypothetical protein
MFHFAKWLVFGFAFGLGLKASDKVVDYAKSDKAKEHFGKVKSFCKDQIDSLKLKPATE